MYILLFASSVRLQIARPGAVLSAVMARVPANEHRDGRGESVLCGTVCCMSACSCQEQGNIRTMLSYGALCCELQLAVISSYLSMPNNPKTDNGIMTVWLQVRVTCEAP